MDQPQLIRILLVEDNDSDVTLVRDLFSGQTGIEFQLEQASRLSQALTILGEHSFDLILLDLGLPDSQGVDTFVELHRKAPDAPILVLTGVDDDTLGLTAMKNGAQDFLLKRQVQGALLRNTIRYAVVRAQVAQEQDERRQRESQEREMDGVERLSAPHGTSVTARIYSGSPLRESAPTEYKAAVAEYSDLLGQALEQRIYRTEDQTSERLRGLSQQLGFLRAGPRDVIDIHASALKTKMKNIPAPKAQAYFEEGRLMALELMGDLMGYYRAFYTAAPAKESLP